VDVTAAELEEPATAEDAGAADDAGATDEEEEAAEDDRALEEEEAGEPASRTPASTAPRHSKGDGTQPPAHTTRVAS